MRFQSKQWANRAQGRAAEVVDIGRYRARMSADEQRQVVSRFRSKGVHALAIEFGVKHEAIEDAIREQMTWLPRAA